MHIGLPPCLPHKLSARLARLCSPCLTPPLPPNPLAHSLSPSLSLLPCQEIKWNYLLTSPYRATDPVLLLTCLAVVCATLALAASLLRQPPSRSPLLLRLATVSWAAYCLFLLPTLGLVNHSPAYWAADRYR